jgi:two-component system alkaline phosphatase synthesis response regulator PhoP
MAGKHILIVEDERDIRDLLKFNLTKDGYRVSAAATGEEGLKLARSGRPDLILLDLMLPGIDGREVCRDLKRDAQTADIPIIMVTAKEKESDIVAGLELGADDYITKPFGMEELKARVRKVLGRQARPAVDEHVMIRTHDLVIDPGRHEVQVGGQPVTLTFTEFRLLQLLAGRPGWVFTRGQIVNAVRGEEYPVTERSVDVQIVGLRKKLGDAGRLIETVRGVGYRFKD